MQSHQKKKTVLTVGLIAKNEEKNIEKCLQCLQPLRQQLGAKIIVGDTGSTDRTVEIAQQYADEVFSMEWKNDFAYARNQVLERANSEWYLTVDADEWLEDATELINFFQSGAYKNFKTAYVIQANYIYSTDNKNEEELQPFQALRMFECSVEQKYFGCIHESIHVLHPIALLSNTLLKHYGYYYKRNKEGLKRKLARAERNNTLLIEEINNNKNDLRLYSHLLDSVLTKDEVRTWSFQAFEVISKLKNDDKKGFWEILISKIARCFFYIHEYDKCIQLENFVFQGRSINSVAHITRWHILMSKIMLSRTNGLEECFWKYIEEKDFAIKDNYKSSVWGLGINPVMDMSYVLRAAVNTSTALMKEYTERETEIPEELRPRLAKIMAEVQPQELYKNNFNECVRFLLALQKKDVNVLPILDKCFCCRDDEDIEDDKRLEMAEAMLSKVFFQMEKEQRLEIAKLSVDNKAVKCYKIYAMENLDLAKECFIHLTQQVEDWEKAPKVIYALAFERCWPLPQKAWNIPYEETHAIVCWLMETKEPFYQQLVNYLDSYPAENDNLTLIERDVRLLYAALKGKIVVDEDNDDEETIANIPAKEVILQLWNRYLNANQKFIQQVYQPETMTEEHLALYPVDIRVQFYFERTKDYVDKKEYFQALKCLKDVVRQDKGMKKFVDILFDDIAELQKEQEQAGNEFFRIAEQLKKYIKELVSFGEVEQAKNALKQLLALSPDDEEAKSLLWVLGAE